MKIKTITARHMVNNKYVHQIVYMGLLYMNYLIILEVLKNTKNT